MLVTVIGRRYYLVISGGELLLMKMDNSYAHKIKVLPDIVHPDQTGFLHGQYIGENIRQLLETIEHCETSKMPGLVFIADFEKTFDKVRLEFIHKCLDYFNFGESRTMS